MLKWFKKHKLKFFSCIALSFCISLFGFMAFSTKTYAFTINENGNLVGENLIQNSNNITLVNQAIVLDCELQNNNTYTFSIQDGTKSGNYALALYNGNQYINITSGTVVSNNYTFTTTSVSQRIYIYANNLQNCNLMLNLGTEEKEWEPYGVWYSQQNYDSVLGDYNQMIYSVYPFKSDLYTISSAIINGNNFTSDYINNYQYIIAFQSTTININSSNFDYLPYHDTSPTGHDILQVVYDYNQPVIITNIITKSELSHTKESYFFIQMFYENERVFSLEIDNETEGDDGRIGSDLFFDGRNTIDRIIIEVRVSNEESQYDKYTTFSTGGTFSQGYASAKQQDYIIINNYSNTISLKEQEILNLKTNISNLQIAYNDLNNSYTNMLNGNNFANLFFTIAETPFASFKQIWNVDFLGVNLAGFVTGILFIGLLIWVVKKIF